MSTVEERPGLPRERRWSQAWGFAPFGVLFLTCAIAVTTASRGWPDQAVTVGIAAGLAGWHWWFVVAAWRAPAWWRCAGRSRRCAPDRSGAPGWARPCGRP